MECSDIKQGATVILEQWFSEGAPPLQQCHYHLGTGRNAKSWGPPRPKGANLCFNKPCSDVMHRQVSEPLLWITSNSCTDPGILDVLPHFTSGAQSWALSC